MTGFEKTARNIIVIASAFNIAMNLFLIPKFGILGAAYATSICTVLWNVMAVIKIKKEYGFVSISSFQLDSARTQHQTLVALQLQQTHPFFQT